MAVQTDARAYRNDLTSLGRQTVATVLRLWARVDLADITRSWTEQIPQATAAVVGAQTVGAELADPYLRATLADDDQRVNVDGLAGQTAEGAPIGSLLYLPGLDALTRIGEGVAPADALREAGSRLAMYAQTTVADSGRLAVTAGMTARPHASGYYRMLQTPSCARCAIQAGKFFRYNAGFRRHPRCFPAGVAVSGPTALAATRRWYEGELVVLSTASGQELSLTGNHPVLTSRGWVPANRLQEGDEVVRSTRPQGATPLVVPDHHQVPSLIEDVWRAFSVTGLDRVPTTAEDFHGDGRNGEVDVVWADRALRNALYTLFSEQGSELFLSGGIGPASGFLGDCSAKFLDLRKPSHAGGSIGGGGLSLALLGRHLRGTLYSSIAGATPRYSRVAQAPADDGSRHAVLGGEGVLTGALQVSGGDGVDGQDLGFPRWDAPGDSFSVETAEGYAARGRDLLDRLSGQVELDCVVELRRVEWSGHVYSLTSSEGWHGANSLIVSNCDCVHIPTREADDGLAFDARAAILAGRVTGISKRTREAIELGADPAQVVNARRGMYTAGGHRLTNAGTTRRGVAGARIIARDIDRALGVNVGQRTYRNWTFDRYETAKYAELFRRGKTYTRRTTSGLDQQYAYRYTQTPRPTPEEIVASTSSRDEAIRLLTNYGYLL